MRLFALASLALAVSSFAQDPAGAKAQSTKSAFRDFLLHEQARGGQWIAQWNPATLTPSAIYGTGLPLEDWRENTLEEGRRHALAALATHREMLGLGTSEFREIIGARMGRSWSFTFDQFFNGVPVLEGRADVRINMKGVIAMLGSRAWPIPADFNTQPALAEQVAQAIAWNKAGTPTGAPQPAESPQPRLVIWGDNTATELAPFHLAWEVAISNVDRDGQGPIGRYYIDAQTGAFLHFENDKHECGFSSCMNAHHGRNRVERVGPEPLAEPLAAPVPTTVTLQCWTRSGPDAWSALVNTPLQGVVLSVPGIGNRTTDQNGQITIDINAPVTINFSVFDGTHYQPLIGPNSPTGSVTVTPGVPATLQLSSSGASTNEAAHAATHYWTDLVNEWCRSILGNSSQLNTASNVRATVNIASTCNAYYTGNTINFYNAGGNCANTAFSTVIAHEWGHGLDDRYGGIANSNAEGLSEGWGDILGMYLVDSPLLGSGFNSPNVALRRGDNTRVYPYSSTSPHAAGQVWMGFAWHLRQQLRTTQGNQPAIDISNDIVVGSIVADATTRVDAVREVFIADDDDGNLLNGVPHYAELSAAATIKGIPFPQIQVASIAHTQLGNTANRLVPRKVTAQVAATSTGTINAVRLHYNAGAGNQVRNMKPNGFPNGFEAVLPGILGGAISYHIEAVHSSNVTVRLPESGEWSYVVSVTPTGPFMGFWLENFDGALSGWTNAQVLGQNDWQVGDPNGRSGTGWADPQNAYSGNNVYGNDLGNTIGSTNWNGAYAANVENYLRSPTINCTGRFGMTLRFRRWLTVEEGLYDQATLFVNGIQVWQNPQVGDLVDTSWQSVEYAIPMADNNAAVQIEWRLKSDAGLQLGGWNIDDVELGTRSGPTLDAQLTMRPEQASPGVPINIAIKTPGPLTPFALAIGDSLGPTLLPGVPPVLVGGNYFVLGELTNATGDFTGSFGAPSIATAVGLTWYSQVVTFDATLSNLVTSNQWLNLFTQTP